MSSRVGTAIPASRSTALSSAAVGLTRSIQTAFSGIAERSALAAFFSEVSEGTNTDSMGTPGTGRAGPTQQDKPRPWQAPHGPRVTRRSIFVAAGWLHRRTASASVAHLPQNKPEGE